MHLVNHIKCNMDTHYVWNIYPCWKGWFNTIPYMEHLPLVGGVTCTASACTPSSTLHAFMASMFLMFFRASNESTSKTYSSELAICCSSFLFMFAPTPMANTYKAYCTLISYAFSAKCILIKYNLK